jgi:hypothetical protein
MLYLFTVKQKEAEDRQGHHGTARIYLKVESSIRKDHEVDAVEDCPSGNL